MENILIISNKTLTEQFSPGMLSQSYRIVIRSDDTDPKEHPNRYSFGAILLEVGDDIEKSIAVLDETLATFPATPVIVASHADSTEHVVQCIRKGAFDFLTLPCSPPKIQNTINQALEKQRLRNELAYLRHEQDVIYDHKRIVAVSPAMQQTMEMIEKITRTDATVLMTGETGTGKSFLAGHIHFNGPRHGRAFIKINCSNLSENLLDSELFGHEKGAFTGAFKTRVGRFEQTGSGTIFLDEIGEIPLPLQAKLLRVLEERSFERLGGNTTIYSNARVIAATNRDIEAAVVGKTFREDLYYRINVLRVHLPPLRQRTECIAPLCSHLLDKICRSVNKKIHGFSPEVISSFTSASWPGNIRQLANTIERAVLFEEGSLIRPENITGCGLEKLAVIPPVEPQTLRDGEKHLVYDALEKSLWIQKDAARMLGISPRMLNYKIKKYGITHHRWRKHT